MVLPSMSSRVKSGAACPTLIRWRSVGLKSVLSLGPSWANAGEWTNDKINNKRKIIFSRIYPPILFNRFSSYLMSFYSPQYAGENYGRQWRERDLASSI